MVGNRKSPSDFDQIRIGKLELLYDIITIL